MIREDVLEKLRRYCAYQERCVKEVNEKLFKLEIYGDDRDDYVLALKQDGFLDEIRFAEAFVRGKFRMKQWGKHKLVRELEFRNIKLSFIGNALKQIEEADYLKTLDQLLEKKLLLTKGPNAYSVKHKVARSVISRGFEPELVWEKLGRN